MDMLVNWIEVFPAWIKAISGVVLAANAITALTPTKWDNEFMDKVSKFLNVLSLNVGKNKNADA